MTERKAPINGQPYIAALLGVLKFVALSIISVPVYFYRLLVIRLARWWRPDLGDILDPIGNMLVNDLFTGKPSRSNVVVPITLRGRVIVSEVANLMYKNCVSQVDPQSGKLVYPQFQQYPCHWLGFTFWKTDTKFSIFNHIFCRTTLGNPTVSEDDVTTFTEKLLNAPFQSGRALWEIHIVQNYFNHADHKEERELSAIILRWHHSVADGVSMSTAVLEGLFGKTLSSPNYIQRQSSEAPLRKLVNLVTISHSVFYKLFRAFQDQLQSAPWVIQDKDKSWVQIFAKSEPILIHEIKYIKNTFKVSFTSVLLSAISSSIHHHLKNALKIENLDSMMCINPIPILGTSVKKGFKNHYAAAVYGIPTRHFSSPIDRLLECDKILEASVRSIVPWMATYYARLLGRLSSICGDVAINRCLPMGVTNFPIGTKDVSLGDKKVLSINLAVGMHEGDAGVGFMVVGYQEHVHISACAEHAVLSREQQRVLLECVRKEISELYKLANGMTENGNRAL